MAGMFDLDATIIRNEIPLTEKFMPQNLLHREGQMQYLASCLKPVVAGRTPRNVFLFGSTGVGKTSLLTWMFEELEDTTDNVKTVYVNCWQNTTPHAIVSKIVSDLKIFTNPKKQTKELLEDLNAYLSRYDKKMILALDEVDRIQDYDILYDFTRSGYGLVLISNDEFALIDVDQRIKSSLSLETVEFKGYTVNEMFDILKDRCDHAFMVGAITDPLIKIAALNADGDARVGIEILRKAALFAEDESKKIIDKEHIIKAKKDALHLKTSQILGTLTKEHKILYNLIGKKENITSTDLFAEYKTITTTPISERTYRKYMTQLVTLRLVKADGDVRWRNYSL
ncbi:AAA family ATPase [archaeon]|nr:AAA family ATPase [archaeon]